MEKVIVVIDRAKDGTYNAYCKECPAFFACGDSIDDAKAELQETIRITKEEIGKEAAAVYPDWLDKEYTLVYNFEVIDFLTYYAGVITPTALGRISGINPKQMWNYMHGVAKPRRAQVEKIQAGLHKLGAELSSISL